MRTEKHEREHIGGKPFACSKCDKKFARKNEIDMHVSNHTGENLLPCSICDKTLKTFKD